MKLKVAANHSYTPTQLAILKAYVGHEITLSKLTGIARRVPVAIVGSVSDDTTLVIDHPHSW